MSVTEENIKLLPRCWRVVVRMGDGTFEVLATRHDTQEMAERLARYEREVGCREAYAVEYAPIRVLP